MAVILDQVIVCFWLVCFNCCLQIVYCTSPLEQGGQCHVGQNWPPRIWIMLFLVFQFCPTYRFERSRPFHGDLKKTMADPLDKVDECAARYSQVQPVKASYSLVQPSTARKVDKSGWKWMKEDKSGWKRMKVNEIRLKWIIVDESRWMRMKSDDSGWKWMKYPRCYMHL